MRFWAAIIAATGYSMYLSQPMAADDAAGWGNVKGQIVWGGAAIPKRTPIEAAKIHQDHEACLAKGVPLTEEWVVNEKNKGICWTFVWLAPATAGAKLPIHPDLEKIKNNEVVIDQPCCQFEPHAVGLRQGQVLVAKNSAPMAHSVRYVGNPIKVPGANVVIPAKQSLPIKDLVADRYPVKLDCTIHPWMTGWVRVFDHPYFAVTDKDGSFEIKKAPAGKYNLVIWHESGFLGGAAGRNGVEITIKKDATTDLGKFEWKPSE
jgi:hypothetical protein